MKIKRFGVAVAGLLLAAQLGTAPTASAELYPRMTGTDSQFLVIAHRGFSYAAPENTLPAIIAAAKANADMVEIDVQRTRDHQLVILHDKTLARTTNVAAVFPSRARDPIGTFTLAEVKRLDAGSWKGAAFVGTRVPTLDEVLTVLAPTSTNLLLELKNPRSYPGYETQVAQVLKAHRFSQDHRVYVHSFSAPALRSFHAAAPNVPLGLIAKSTPRTLTKFMGEQTFNPQAQSVNDLTVDQAQGKHLRVFAWLSKGTPDTAAEIEKLADDGVNGIISDRPDLARAELATSVPSTASLK